jgi:hypothetical protein
MRQTWEEIGIDLAEREYMYIGQLDDREITTSLGKRLLMVLSPYVFLQLSPNCAPPDPTPTTTLVWTPLSNLVSQSQSKWSTVTVDAASRMAPRHAVFLRYIVRALVGSMQFPAIIIHARPTSPSKELISRPESFKLWGLTLGMILDLMAYMLPPSSPDTPFHLQTPYPIITPEGTVMRVELVAPSLASVFPHFSYPDVNFWIWFVFLYFQCPNLTYHYSGYSGKDIVRLFGDGKRVYALVGQTIGGECLQCAIFIG